MNAFLWLVWKEWREHRTALALTGAFLTVAMSLWLGVFLTPRAFTDPFTVGMLALIPAAVFLLTTGGDIGGGRRGALRFLERLPAGLHRPLLAKLAFFLTALLAATVLGLHLVGTFATLRGPGLPVVDASGKEIVYFLAGYVGLCLWCFAVSPWLPRGPLALPASFLVIATVLWPLWLHFAGHPVFQFSERFEFLLVPFLLGSLPSAYLSFTRGRRFGQGPKKAALVGLVAAVLTSSAPTLAWAGLRLHDAHKVDMTLGSYWINDFAADSRGNLYLVVTFNREWRRALRFDAETKEVTPIGPLGVENVIRTYNPILGKEQIVLWRGREANALVFDTAAGTLETAYEKAIFFPAGYGYRSTQDFYDPFRERKYERPDGLSRRFPILISRLGWLHADTTGWKLFDPDTEACTPLDLPTETLPFSLTLVDVDLAYLRNTEGNASFLYDLESGATRAIQSEALLENPPYPYAETGNRLFFADGRTFYLDTSTATFHELPIPDGSFCALPGRPTHVLTNLQLAEFVFRLNLEDGSSEQVFPPVSTSP